MTKDEIETRIERLETRQTVQAALIHCLLPAIPPTSRHLVLQQFAQYCRATEDDLRQANAPEHLAHFQLSLLRQTYTSLQGALQLLEEHERKHGAQT